MISRLVVSIAALATFGAATLHAQDSVARMDAIFSRYAVPGSPGCAVALSTANDTVSRGFGLADLEHDVPINSATIFEAGSVSKQVTAAAVVLLALDGKLSFDDDVRKFVPELPQYPQRITIRHLLNHTSGLRDWGSVVALAGWPRGSRVYNHRIVVDVASRQKSLNYAPGTHYSYTNTGYNLLAVIVARISGQSFAQFTRDRIYAPLGMTNSSWRDDYTRVVKGRAAAYAPAAASGAWRLDMPFENAHGNGGMLTTVQDLLRFTKNLETGKLGGPRFIEEMHRQARLNSGKEITYASGLVVSEWRGLKEVSHSGATGGYRTYLARLPERGVAVAVLCNAANANPTALARQVLETVVTPPVAVTARPAVADSVSVARLLGTYRNTRVGQPVRMTWRNGQLAVGNGLLLSPHDNGRYRSQTGDIVVFDPPRAGTRTGFYVLTRDDSTRYEPVEAYTPTAADIAAYVGTYSSEEAEATFDVVAEGTNLRLRDRYGNLQAMLPSYRDSFTSGGTIVTFVRNSAGKVTAINVGSDRAWSVRFDKR
jgi:CubicO group peptidase (beta-lactamase class C family)